MPDERLRVLIVEDDGMWVSTLTTLMARHQPCSIEVVRTVAEARKTLSSQTFDVVLLDMRLPDGSGVDVARVALAAEMRPAVIVVTGGATAAEGATLVRMGVREVLDKPFDPATFHAAVEGARQQRERSARLRDAEASLRSQMIREALSRSGGSVQGAARFLGISRQRLQHILRRERERGARE